MRSLVGNVFTTVADLVQDALRSGELRAGDSEQIVALILGAVHGVADLEQFGLVKFASESETATALSGLLAEIMSRQIPAICA